jgi:hypothetical protein
VALKAESVRDEPNSLFSQGVLSMNQPKPLPSMSRVRVPELGRPELS